MITMNNLFNRVKDAVQNAIDNGYEPLKQASIELAADLQEKASEFAEDKLEDIAQAVQAVKDKTNSVIDTVKDKLDNKDD
jgi:division protein CdvB (Snf7/Vps24/ESCRT-III family)